jgi:phosphoribosylaminoimidazolecarboxamide formyltransferase/IMP cyclohydrolase
MTHTTPIRAALLSVYDKSGLEPLVLALHAQGTKLISTGGTLAFIHSLGLEAVSVESITGYPEIFGGRVKTLHPKIFGGILYRRTNQEDRTTAETMAIPPIDLVVVDLYPFSSTVASGASHEEVIEKIDIGGISLLRAAAKNFDSVAVVSGQEQYQRVTNWIANQKGALTHTQRHWLAAEAFRITSHYDTSIFQYLSVEDTTPALKVSIHSSKQLRYGENPHQTASFFGNLDDLLEQKNGKELSFNNLVDLDASLALASEFDAPACAIIKHTNACGMALGTNTTEAYTKALAADPVSAFGGVIAFNRVLDLDCAQQIHSLFFEILAAPGYTEEALTLLCEKKNRIILVVKNYRPTAKAFKTVLHGVLEQDQDLKKVTAEELTCVTKRKPTTEEIDAMLFADVLAKHAKSNTIILAKNGELIASGVGQTSRVDALKQAIEKAKSFNRSLYGAVMASDAFFPFPDCVQIAHEAGIYMVIQPGGSIKDQASIDYCDAHNMCMVFTGIRHFKH